MNIALTAQVQSFASLTWSSAESNQFPLADAMALKRLSLFHGISHFGWAQPGKASGRVASLMAQTVDTSTNQTANVLGTIPTPHGNSMVLKLMAQRGSAPSIPQMALQPPLRGCDALKGRAAKCGMAVFAA